MDSSTKRRRDNSQDITRKRNASYVSSSTSTSSRASVSSSGAGKREEVGTRTTMTPTSPLSNLSYSCDPVVWESPGSSERRSGSAVKCAGRQEVLPFIEECSLLTAREQPLHSAKRSVEAPVITDMSSQNVGSPGLNLVTTDIATPVMSLSQSQGGAIISPSNNVFCYPRSKYTIIHAAIEIFPIFDSGDVVITSNLVTPPKEWRLQSEVLARHSLWFAQSFKEPRSDKQCNGPPWFLYTLEIVNGAAELVRQSVAGEIPDPTVRDKLKTEVQNEEDLQAYSRESIVKSTFVETIPLATTKIYNQIFGVFYNISPSISSDKIDEALLQTEQFIKHTSTLKCLHLIQAHLGNALLQHRQSLFQAIASDPARWLILATALQNDSIYTESLTHIIGAHPSWPWPTKPSHLPSSTLHLIARKSAHLNILCLKAERALLLLTITVHSQPVSPEKIPLFDTWFIVATFRDILAREFHALGQSGAARAALRRGTVFRKIARGGSAYMDYGEMERLMRAVMPAAVPSLEEDLGLLKRSARGYVEELARNELMIDGEASGVGYLTCARIEREDIPWRAERGREGV